MEINVKALQEAIAEKFAENDTVLKQKKADIEKFYTKADELYNTTTTNNGEEFVPGNVLQPGITDLSPEVNDFTNLFSAGFQGTQLDRTSDFALVGKAGVMGVRSENKNAVDFTKNNITTGPNSDVLTVKQGFFKKEIGITEIEATFSIERLDTLIRKKLDDYFRNTILAYLLNADSDVTATNINDVGVAISSSTDEIAIMSAEALNDGIRKTGITNGVLSLATLTKSDYSTLLKAMPEYSGKREELAIFCDQATAVEIEDVLQEELKYTDRDAIINGYFGKYKGIKHISTEFLTKVDSTGKRDLVNPANNTKGQIILVYLKSVIHGFGKRVKNVGTEANIDGDLSISLTTNFGAGVANQKAGLGKVVVTGLIDV